MNPRDEVADAWAKLADGPLRVWAVRRKGSGRIVTAPAFNPYLARAHVLYSSRPRRYEVVYADLVPTEWTPEETS